MAAFTQFCGLLAFLGGLLLPGCSPRSGHVPVREQVLLHNDFEGYDGWYSQVAGLTTEKAHSGRWAVVVSPEQEFSGGYRATLGQLSPHHRPRQFTLGAWVWVPNADADARLVLAIDSPNDPDHPILYKSVYVNESLALGRWRHVSQRINLPDSIHSDNRISVYLWRGFAKDPVYADDLELTELW